MPARADRFSRAQAHAVWVMWLAYGAFYFCRSNSSVFSVGLHADPMVHLSSGQIGLVLGGMKLTYGVGQLVNGQLAERVSPRLLLATGMLGSAALNVAFGLGTGFYFYLFVWAANGYFQSLGWAPCMRIAASWFPARLRGRAVGLIGTGYSATGGLTWIVAGAAAARFGWRGALYLPAGLLAATALYTILVLRDRPPTAVAGVAPPVPSAPRPPWRTALRHTMADRRLWLLAASLALIDASRYGFSDWGIRHLMDVRGGSIDLEALEYSILPVAGAAGAISAGWSSDRWSGGRRVPAIVAYSLLLALAGVLYGAGVARSVTLAIASLAAIGFALGGAQTLLVGAAPMDLQRGGTPAAAVGFVNMFGYLGAFAQDQITPRLIRVPLLGPLDAAAPDWHLATAFWTACAVAAALVVAPLWRAGPPPEPDGRSSDPAT